MAMVKLMKKTSPAPLRVAQLRSARRSLFSVLMRPSFEHVLFFPLRWTYSLAPRLKRCIQNSACRKAQPSPRIRLTLGPIPHHTQRVP